MCLKMTLCLIEDGIVLEFDDHMHEVVLEEEGVNEEEGVIKDEGYQLANLHWIVLASYMQKVKR